MSVVVQWEVQRRGGVCARYPTACVVRDLVSRLGIEGVALDLTYGLGVFWYALPGWRVIGFDIRRLNWVRQPHRFYRKPAWAWQYMADQLPPRIDLVVADPPFNRWERGKEFANRWFYQRRKMLGKPEYILEAAAKASRHYKAPLLVHYSDRWVPKGFTVLEELRFKPYLPRGHNYTSWFALLAPEDGAGSSD